MHLASAVVPLFEHAVDGIVAALPEPDSPLWESGIRRHGEDAHRTTRAIVFKWLSNNWRPGRPFMVGATGNLPPDLTDAVSACAGALERRLDGKVAKLVLAELAPGRAITPHRDRGSALALVHRCELPVVTSEGVSFVVDGEEFDLRAGTVYEFDNTRVHAVANHSARRRIDLICDIMPAHLCAGVSRSVTARD